jgi:hypothetical protein
LLYSFNNNSLNIHHQNLRSLQGKTKELTSSLYPELPYLLCLKEHHLVNPELDHTHIEHYNLGAEYCRQTFRQGGACIFVHEKLKFPNFNFTKNKTLKHVQLNFNFLLAISVFYPFIELHPETYHIS